MDLIYVLSIAGISLYTLLGIFLLFGTRQSSISNRFLGIFFLLWALNFLDGLLLLNGFYLKYPHLAMWEEPMALLYGPLIYFYTKSLLLELKPSIKSIFPHLIPFILFVVGLIVFYHSRSAEFKIGIIESATELKQPMSVFSMILIIFIHVFFYFFKSFKALREYHAESRQFHSTETWWLDNTLKYLVIILFMSLGVSILQYFGNLLIFKSGLVVLIISILVFISRIFFQAFEDPGLFVRKDVRRYRSNPIEREKQDAIQIKIKEAMDVERIFLNSELTIDDLASAINEGSRSVSQVINERFEQSFFDLVNTYRVQESERIFKDNKDPNKTILEVIYEAGFNSKSSFNTQFKKRTGMTPTEYRNLHSSFQN